MPHFIIDCSDNLQTKKTPDQIMKVVYVAAESTGLFAQNDIKVRLSFYKHFMLGQGKQHFLHVSSYIIEGRSKEQIAQLSRLIIESLNQLLPDVDFLSVNVYEFDLTTYSNKSLIDPLNFEKDRHFLL